MDYSLAKKLKDAGFPQDPNGRGYQCFLPRGELCDLPEKEHTEKCKDWDCKRTETPDVYPPTLSELIEACGADLWQLTKILRTNGELNNMENRKTWEHWWKAEGLKPSYGVTPEEAVANLYLAINKKE